jgi:hypothetical protein
MARTVDYPWASFARALAAAEAVDSLGGKCTLDMCAHKMGMSVGGGFKAIISAASKFNLLENSKGKLTCTELYRLIKYAYTKEEKIEMYRKAFLSAPIFQNIYERFRGIELPISMLDKIFIREFDVEESVATRVVKYFLEGAKFVEIIDENNIIKPNIFKSSSEEIQVIPVDQDEEDRDISRTSNQEYKPTNDEIFVLNDSSDYIVHIKGLDMDLKITIKEEDDLDIVNVMLNKLRKKISQN